MRAAAGEGLDWLPNGSYVAGYAVEGQAADRVGPERRYDVRAPGGSRATLIAARAPFAGRAARSRFVRLAARRKELDHPGAIRVHAVAEHEGHGVLITDEYPERTLGDLLEPGTPLAPERVVAMFAPVAEALDVAHARGLVHRELAAGTLLLSGRKLLMLDTFGILKGDADTLWTTAHAPDIRYVSPDVLRGEELEARSNVYSLGALIVHALTGAPPFSGDHAAIVYRHMSDRPPRLSERVPALGRDADEVMARALSKEPSRRPESAGALVLELSEALGVPAPDIAIRRAPITPERSAPASTAHARGRRAVAIAGILAAVGAGAVAGTVAEPFGGDEPARATAPVRPDPVWPQLGERRAALRAELASARVPAAQARAASSLADLFARAARASGPGALRAASGETAIAYSRLAAAVRAHDRTAYADAANAVGRADDRLSLAASRH